MITLEKLLTELKAESLNEIVAGNNGKGKGAKGGMKGGGGGSSADSISAPSQTTAATESGEEME